MIDPADICFLRFIHFRHGKHAEITLHIPERMKRMLIRHQQIGEKQALIRRKGERGIIRLFEHHLVVPDDFRHFIKDLIRSLVIAG